MIKKLHRQQECLWKDSMKVVIAHFKYFTDGFSINKGKATRLLKHQKVSLATYLLANGQIAHYGYVLKRLLPSFTGIRIFDTKSLLSRSCWLILYLRFSFWRN